MSWTTEEKLLALFRLPWRLDVTLNESEGYFVARIAEIEGLVVTGDTSKELGQNLWDAFQSVMGALLDEEDQIQLPVGVTQLPWVEQPIPTRRGTIRVRLADGREQEIPQVPLAQVA